MADCPRCGSPKPDKGVCRFCETTQRAAALDLTVLRQASSIVRRNEGDRFAPGLDPMAQRRIVSRYFGDSSVRTAPPPPPPATTSLEPTATRPRSRPKDLRGLGVVALASSRGSPDWWRERLRQGDLDRLGGAPAGVPRLVTLRGARPHGDGAVALLHRTPPKLVIPAPATTFTPAAPPGAPYGDGTTAAPSSRDVTPAPPPRLDLATTLWRGRSNHVLAIALGGLLLGVAILVWAPGRTADPESPAIAPAPGVVPSVAPSAPGEAEAEEGGAAGGAAPAPGDVPGCGSGCEVDSSAAAELMDEINTARRANGQPDLRADEDLATVAHTHVQEMVDEARLFHTANGVLGRRVTNWEVLAESIGVGPSVSSLMDAFLRSDVDRRNLLDPAFEHVGVAALPQGQRLWVTVLFSDENDPGSNLTES